MTLQYWDKEGKEISRGECLDLQTPDYSRIAQNTLPKGYWISTVWLGTQRTMEGDAPLLFETAVHWSDRDMRQIETKRWSTLGEARVGHARTVMEWSAK